MMNDHSWGFGMAYGMWLVPLAIILLLIYFFKGKRPKGN